MPLTPEQREVAAMRLGEAFEALFPNGAMRPRPTMCSACGGALDERRACYIVSDLPIARSYRIVGVYDRPDCLPDPYGPIREVWDGSHWCTVDQHTGALLHTHALQVRPLDAAEEAILLLAPHQRENPAIVATLRGFFEATPEALASPAWLTLIERTTVTFATGHHVTLAGFLVAHRHHFAQGGTWDALVGVYPTVEERFACFAEESAIVPGEIAS